MPTTIRQTSRALTLLCLCTLGCNGADGQTEAGGSDTGSGTAVTEAPSTGASDSPTSTAADASTAGDTGATDPGDDTTGASDSSTGVPAEPFSFFVTSLVALQELSGDPAGFGGDLRYGEDGPGAGLRGADKICAEIAERSMPGAGNKPWRAFLSAVAGEDGQQVDAIDRIGEGPWYDRLGRLVAADKADILSERPTGIDPTIKEDLPNEDGVPNHQPNPNEEEVDNHDTLTGTNEQGKLYGPSSTCNDWTGATGTEGRPRVGHSWARYGMMGPKPGPDMDGSMANWMSSLDESGCAPGVSLIEMGPPDPNSDTVGSGGGYGGFYCFSLIP